MAVKTIFQQQGDFRFQRVILKADNHMAECQKISKSNLNKRDGEWNKTLFVMSGW